jgi:hypothetical protein
VPISSRVRVLDYLGSAPNLAGSGLGLIALFIIAITGLGGALWPALLLLAYATGAVIGQLSFASTGHGEEHAGWDGTAPSGQVALPLRGAGVAGSEQFRRT